MGKASRKQSARAQMQAERRRQEARDRMMRRIWISGSAVLAVVVAVGVGIVVQMQRAEGTNGEFTGNLPQATVSDGAVAYKKGSGDMPVVHVWEDFQCPFCQEFEERSGAMLKKLAANGKAKVVYHPVVVIDERSLRAGSAALCAAKQGKFMPYHNLLFENQQPETSGQGFETSVLKDFGDKIGIGSSEFYECVEKLKYKDEVRKNTQQASTNHAGPDGRFSTPTVVLNGRILPNQLLFSPGALKEAILNAGSGEQESSSPSPSDSRGPSDTPSPSVTTPSTPARSSTSSRSSSPGDENQ